MATSPTLWAADGKGKDKYYEHYRLSSSQSSQDLRNWVDQAYFIDNLAQYLDKDFAKNLRDTDFYGRLWELEVVEWLRKTGLALAPTNGKGPDFCLQLNDGNKIWVEAVLSRPDQELKDIEQEALASNGQLYNTPREQTALRYSTSLVGKAKKIKADYLTKYVSKDDYIIIAVSAFAPGAMRPDMDLFMLSILPIDHQVVYFPLNGKTLDETTPRPTHTLKTEHAKKSGALVKKEFIYPGSDFPYINGVLFSEASNLQQLLGACSSRFDAETNTPHIFQNYSSRGLPAEFTDAFYYHKFRNNGDLVTLDCFDPKDPSSGSSN